MIELLTLGKDEWQEVRIPSDAKRVLVEVAADEPIDFGICESVRAFEYEDENPPQWFEAMKKKDFEVDRKLIPRSFLILWNANYGREVSVAYKITPL